MRTDPGSEPEGGRDPDAQSGVFDLGLEALFTVACADGSFEHLRHLAEEAESLRTSELCQGSNVCYECA